PGVGPMPVLKAPPASEPPAPAPVAAPVAPDAAAATVTAKGLAGWLRGVATVDKTKAEVGTGWRARRKGPFTAEMAERELEAAGAIDVVLEIFFTFALQFFEYSALFVIHGDLAEGSDASGPGADRARVAGIGVP